MRILCAAMALGLGCGFFVTPRASGQVRSLPGTEPGKEPKPFRWPEGKRAALSLSFDDARLSQIDRGLALLEKCGVKVTFFLSPDNAEKRLAGWQKAVAAGHEIANHSLTHPCTGNYAFSLHNALENYTLEAIAQNIDGGDAEIQRLLGVKPMTFAYPCGQKFVGRGLDVRSYVPLVAQRYIVGRGYLDEAANDPAICDLAQATGMGFDDMDYDQMLKLVTEASSEGRWLILVGHEIGERGHQVTDASALTALCKYARDPANGLWVDTVEAIGKYIRQQRAGSHH
jgi:peptidoglycan/xylan/chitin deacetylase (PgdA/CDA1 family)